MNIGDEFLASPPMTLRRSTRLQSNARLSPVVPPKTVWHWVEDETLKKIVQFLKKYRPNIIMLGEKYDIILLQSKMRNEYLHKVGNVKSPNKC